MREAKKNGHRTKLVRDVLYIDGNVYTAEIQQTSEPRDPTGRTAPVQSPINKPQAQGSQRTPTNRQSQKRQRTGSTPGHSDTYSWGRAGEQSPESLSASDPRRDGLSFVSLNVCGIKNRLNYTEFCDFITQYDILALTETKTDHSDDIHIPGYVTYMKNRRKLSSIRSG